MDNLSFDSEKFTAVWQRVTENRSGMGIDEIREPQGEVQTEPEMLCRMMEVLAQDAECLRKLARKCQSRTRDTLQCLVRDNLQILKKLRVRYFILTGGAYSPNCECKPFRAAAEGLRTIHISAVGLAESFTSATADYNDLTYNEFAEIQLRHAETAACLIGNMM
ncbi:MAG: hypothetical protein FWC96_07085 [Oscillospiraceae bacterium]|nr:hypothetical protein [Oscillospiraceae bacterium]